ncbi:kunitz-type serine protease inhibitor-like [Drosophila elegans]|uniref:kunitz-type serine protease inhibitor-like n=1 Tax=Drosophila elegans TaxID=30023 RepID=UPI0007E6B44B|nr:kunitz-type serine protease inhibitor-like [Drosophila elegans]
MNQIKAVVSIFLILVLGDLVTGSKDPVCGLVPAANGFGGMSCLKYKPSFTYFSSTNMCETFIYGGCGGNANRFSTKQECEAKCKG